MKEIELKEMNLSELQGLDHGIPVGMIRGITITGPAYTGMNNGEILFCCGIQDLLPRQIGEAWFVFSPFGRNYIGVYMTVKDLLHHHVLPRIPYWRVQATADVSRPETRRFLEHLGFQREALLRKAGINGEDVEMFSIIREGGV